MAVLDRPEMAGGFSPAIDILVVNSSELHTGPQVHEPSHQIVGGRIVAIERAGQANRRIFGEQVGRARR